MSKEALSDFLNMAAQDEAIGSKFQTGTIDEKIAAAVELGAQHGHDFTTDECREVFQAARLSASGSLTEEQLEAVSGGGIGSLWAWLVNAVGGNDSGDSGGGQGVCGVRA